MHDDEQDQENHLRLENGGEGGGNAENTGYTLLV